MHLVLVLVAVWICLLLLNSYLPGSKPWIVTFKMIVSAVVMALALVYALVTAGYAATDGPFFGPWHYDEPVLTHERSRY